MTTTIEPEQDAPNVSEQQQTHRDFVRKIMALCEDNGARADLRSGLGKPYTQAPRMHRHLLRFIPERMGPDARQARYTVASLIAARPRNTRDADARARAEAEASANEASANEEQQRERPKSQASGEGTPRSRTYRNLGFSLAESVRLDGGRTRGSAEGELHLLTRQSLDALLPRLPSLVRHLLSAEAPVDWEQLLADLTWWNHSRDRIATNWFESFYRTLYANEERARRGEDDSSHGPADSDGGQRDTTP